MQGKGNITWILRDGDSDGIQWQVLVLVVLKPRVLYLEVKLVLS